MTDEDVALAPVEATVDEPDETAAEPAPVVVRRPRAARTGARRSRKAASAARPSPAPVSKSKSARHKAAAAAPPTRKAAPARPKPRKAAPAAAAEPTPAARVAVKAGDVEIWMDGSLAAVLTDKDRRKLKSALKRAVKRAKKKR